MDGRIKTSSVYWRELAPGTVRLTYDWVRGDDSKQNSYYICDELGLRCRLDLIYYRYDLRVSFFIYRKVMVSLVSAITKKVFTLWSCGRCYLT